MSDIEVTKENIEIGTSEALGALFVSYPDEVHAINSILNQGYAGLNISPNIKTIIDNSAQNGSITNHLYENINDQVEGAAVGFVRDLGAEALSTQKNLALTITREVRILTAQGHTVEQALFSSLH